MSTTQVLGRVAIINQAAWSSTQTYDKLDVVNYKGSSFMALQSVPIDTAPPSVSYSGDVPTVGSSEYWTLVAAIGKRGPDGSGNVSTIDGVEPVDGDVPLYAVTYPTTISQWSIGQVLAYNGINLSDSKPSWTAVNALSAPSNGVAGQVLQNSGGGSYTWASAGVPANGTAGQVLAKTSDGYAWASIGLPVGGTANQVLMKNTGDNYNVSWKDIDVLPPAGASGAPLIKNSGNNYDVTWGTIMSTSDVDALFTNL